MEVRPQGEDWGWLREDSLKGASVPQLVFSWIGHTLGHKSSLGTFKKTEIISGIFSNHNAMRIDINYRKKSVKNTNTWRLNNTLLNN